MASVIGGPFDMQADIDDEGHLEYKVKLRVMANRLTEGPYAAMQAVGLPLPGSNWIWEDDPDVRVICLPRCSIRRNPGYKETDPVEYYDLGFTYTSKVCDVLGYLDPLLRPQKITGSSIKYTEEATHDRWGVPLQTSSWEAIRGPQIEFDANRPQVVIEQNVPDLQLGLLSQLCDSVNDAPLWGAPSRCVKFSEYAFSEECRGPGYAYYRRRLVFDIFVKWDQETGSYLSGFDREVLDEGSKALWGQWNQKGKWEIQPIGYDETTGDFIWPDWRNPSHFCRFRGKDGNPCRVLLNGWGEPWDPNAEEESKEWVISDGATASTFTGTCTAALGQAATAGPDFRVYGPYVDATAATEAASSAGSLVYTQRPITAAHCDVNRQGKIKVEKYVSANLLLLSIPTTFGSGYVGGGP